MKSPSNNLDFLAARLHARRSRLAEAERLDSLCRLPDFPAAARAVYPDAEFHNVADYQRRLIKDLVQEVFSFAGHVDETGADLLNWVLVRFQVENMKVLIRAFMHRTPLETPQEYLLALPPELALNNSALLAANNWEDFAALLPSGAPRTALRKALATHPDHIRPFFLEAALDRGFFLELLDRTGRISGEDKELIKGIARQEVDAFHLMLAVRGRFHYGLASEALLPLHVLGSAIPRERFGAMLAAPDIRAAANLAVGRAIDVLPGESDSTENVVNLDPAALEALAWKRFLRLSNRAFRHSHMGLAAVVGYVGIRRVEVANLITVSEAIGRGVAANALRARLIPRADLESVYV